MHLLVRKSPSFFLFILFLFSTSFLRCQSIQIGGQPIITFTPDSWSYYRDKEKQTSIKDILAKYSAGEFKRVGHGVLNAGIPREYYWIHFSLVNKEARKNDLIIDIENPRLNELELFEVSDNEIRSLGKAGDFYPFSQRLIMHKNFIYPVNLGPNRFKEYFLFVNQVGHTFTLPIKIFTRKSFQPTTFNDYLMDGVTYGILLFVGVLSLLFFLTSGHYVYLYYGLYLLTGIMWLLSYFGLGYQCIWGNYPKLNTAFAPLWASLNISVNVQICQVLLKLRKINLRLNHIANSIKYLLLLVALLPLVIDLNQYGYAANYGYLVIFLFAMLSALLVVLCSVFLYSLKGLLPAKLYLLASLLKVSGIIHLILLELGITPAIYNMEGLLQIGGLIEITVLSYALAKRYSIFKSKTYALVIEAHEEERALISKDIHDSISSALTGINYAYINFMKKVKDLPPKERLQLDKISYELAKLQIEARNISHNTMPDYIKTNSIVEVIGIYVNEKQSSNRDYKDKEISTKINFSYNEKSFNFSEAVKLNIFRIIQELVTNILKHSKATNVDLIFSFEKKELIIILDDNGIGIYQPNDKGQGGMGMKNVMSRVQLLGGSISIKSPTYKKSLRDDNPFLADPVPSEVGTMIKIKIPYRSDLSDLFKSKNEYGY